MALYVRLSFTEREELSRHLAEGHSLRAIAHILGRAPSSVSREIRRNTSTQSNYRALASQHRAKRFAHQTRRIRKLTIQPELWEAIIYLLRRYWSPQQIVLHLRRCYPTLSSMQISHETIYTYVYVLPRGSLRRELIACLRQHHRRRRNRTHTRRKYAPIQDFLSIEERPAIVAKRTVPGHWEGDLLMGSRNASAIGTLVERTTRWLLLVPLKAKDATSVRHAFSQALMALPVHLRRTLTYDQGQEMVEHRLFTRNTHIQVYFAHPHCPWERGTNENTNGLLRQFFPKGTNFHNYSPDQIQHVQDLMNERPRKVLDWHSPDETFNQLLH